MKSNYSGLRLLFIIPLYFLSTLTVFGQIEVEPTGTLFTPESLVTNVFLGDGVEVTNLTYAGDPLAVGYFTNGEDDVGMDRGIVMSSGFAATAATPNNGGGTTGQTNSMANDSDIAAITTSGTNDVSIYEITFIPINDTLRFKYSFASEEYPEYACNSFNDAFGFFISGPGINGPFSNNGENIAFVPDPTDPTGTTFTTDPVTINFVNPGVVGAAGGSLAQCTPPVGSLAYSQYYNDNSGSTSLTYDGILDVFIAQVVVVPCEEYVIKLAICDAGDTSFDSAVFLEAKSFGTGSLDVDISTVSLDGTLAEGCSDGLLSFNLPNAVESDLMIDYTIFGTAENGVDYQFIPEDLFIAAGDSSVSVPVIVFDDGVIEGVESIGIDIQRDPCNRDTFFFYITETQLIPPELQNDTTICRFESVQLDGTINITLPPPPTFVNETDFPITLINPNDPPPPGTPLTVSEIDVFSVQPSILQEGVIKRVCINVDHNWISDVDAYLVSPGGQFLELTTDNGAGGNDYIETCFTPSSTDTIDFGNAAPSSAAPFTGDWQPEGVFSDLWDGEYPTNGTWQLQLKDDSAPDFGTLLDWSICFNPLYQIDYLWTPSTGLSCADCPDPIATPDETTTYVLTAMDTYGCTVFDSITITVEEVLAPPIISCDDITAGSINFSWEEIIGATGYEVSINGGPWINPIPGPLEHLVDGLSLNSDATIAVRGLALCSGEIDSLTCTTTNCTAPDLMLNNLVNLACNGDTNGSISVSANGLFPPFTYMIENIDTNDTGNFTNLVGGIYTVIVSDIGDCTTSIQVEVMEPTPLATSPVILGNVLCNGNGEGEATFEVTGGTAPYTFIWSNTTADSIAMNLAFGEYYVTITDFQGCIILDTLSIIEPTPMLASTAPTSTSCNGESDGLATVNTEGGVLPYTYLWDANANDQTTMTAVDLSAGEYFVTVTDFQGCLITTSAIVTENTEVSLSMSGTNALCNSSLDGTATVLANGGTGGTYSYLWDDPSGQTTATAIDLQQNTYNVIVTDSAGCTATGTFDVLAPNALTTTTITESEASCSGLSDGIITIGATGGAYPYTYTWADDPSITDSTRIDLFSGAYSLTVSDANGCSEISSFFINEPPQLAVSFDNSNVACNGNSTGTSLVIVGSGSGGNFQYFWDAAANNQTTQEAINLGAGTYSVTVVDDNGCIADGTTEIIESSNLELSLGQMDVLCFGNNTGNITLDISGGTTPYFYEWTGPNGYTADTEDVADLLAGDYQVLVTDDAGCTAIMATQIQQPSTGIMSSMSPEDQICFNGTDGTATVTVGGGTGPFTYLWDNNETTASVNNLPPGMHFVTITDSGNCTSVDTAIINQQDAINVSLSQDGSSCFNGDDGTASISDISYNNTPADITSFNIEWSNGETIENLVDLIGGETYSVTVTDALGCTGEEAIAIFNPDEIGFLIQNTSNTSCSTGSDGSATVVGNGGTAPYEYLWDLAANNQNTSTANDLLPGEYTTTITDLGGCTTTATITIEAPDPISIQLFELNESCQGQADGSVATSIQGGTAPYAYVWSNGATTADITELNIGTYELSVTDAAGCMNSAIATLTAPPLMTATVESESVSCFGDENGQIILSADGGTAPYRYSIDEEGTYSATTHYIGLAPGDYTASVFDANGCSVELPVTVGEPAPLELVISGDKTLEVGPESFPYSINVNEVNNAQGEVEITWLPPYNGSLFCPDSISFNCLHPVVDIDVTSSFSAVAVDEMGCKARAEMTITVTKERPVFVPTAFTPNGDQVNDRLLVHGKEGTVVTLFRIFDRWGNLIFQVEDFDVNNELIGWDGSFKGELVNPGVFVWYVEVVHVDGIEEVFKGNTTLIR